MSLSIRKTASVAALFAASVFASCEKEPTPGPDDSKPNGKTTKITKYYDEAGVMGKYTNDSTMHTIDLVDRSDNSGGVFSKFNSNKNRIFYIGDGEIDLGEMLWEGVEMTAWSAKENAHFMAILENNDTIIYKPRAGAKIIFSDMAGELGEKVKIAQARVRNAKEHFYDYRQH